MYLSDLIRPEINKILQEKCVGKKVLFYTEGEIETTITCKSVEFQDDDGYCWLRFTDLYDRKYIVYGQGIDIYFEIEEN